MIIGVREMTILEIIKEVNSYQESIKTYEYLVQDYIELTKKISESDIDPIIKVEKLNNYAKKIVELKEEIKYYQAKYEYLTSQKLEVGIMFKQY